MRNRRYYLKKLSYKLRSPYGGVPMFERAGLSIGNVLVLPTRSIDLVCMDICWCPRAKIQHYKLCFCFTLV